MIVNYGMTTNSGTNAE